MISSAGLSPAAEAVCVDDGMRPSQWWDAARCTTGEQKLLLALLFDTYRLLFLREGEQRRRNSPSELKARQQAIAWVLDTAHDDDELWLDFTFAQVCGVLGLPTAPMRQQFIDGYRGMQRRRRERSYKTNYNAFTVECPEADRRHQRKPAA